MSYVIKLSKPGKDVKTCGDEDLIFSSDFNTLKVAYQDDPSSSGSYAHGLGYAPAYFATSGSNFLGQNATSPFESIFYSTSTRFYYSDPCKYYLFYQNG